MRRVSCPGGPAIVLFGVALVLALPASASESSEAELGREYQKLVNNITLARQRDAWSEEVVTLATVMRMFPDLTDPRRRVFVPDVKKLAGERAKLYNDTLERLGAGVSG